jgi:hypothetical protein
MQRTMPLTAEAALRRACHDQQGDGPRLGGALEARASTSRRQGARQPMLGSVGLVTEADVTGSRGGRGAQKQLCEVAAARSSRRDKAAWAEGGLGSAPRRRGGRSWAEDLGLRLHTPVSALPPPGPWCWQEMRGCDRRIGRRSAFPPPTSGLILAPDPWAIPATPASEGRLTIGSCARHKIPVFLQRLRPEPG